MADEVTFQEVFELATLLPPGDKQRLIERIAPQIDRELKDEQRQPRSSERGILLDTEPTRDEYNTNFEREIAAFEALRPELLGSYRGEAVAIYEGRVVAHGKDKMAVLDYVLAEFGPVPCYIEWVTEEFPRRVRMPSTWISP